MATEERSYYSAVCDTSKQNVRQFSQQAGVFTPPSPSSRLPPCSLPSVIHYSFDMAQQVHYPSDPLKSGPIYFLIPRKCGIFGLCCEAIPRQINYLIDEASDTGKGANTIVSMLHHFLEHHGLGESHLHLHADNCVGQNKNNTMLHYLMWRVMVGLHRQITLSFLIVGHTKSAPDWCFGLMKQRFRRTMVSNLRDLESVVNCSAEVNVAQLVGTQLGEVVVPTYNWSGMFAGRLRKLKHQTIPSLLHVILSTWLCGREERVRFRERAILTSDEQQLGAISAAVVPPSGLSLKRQWYLYNSIRMYCPQEVQDKVCPLSLTPLSSPPHPPLPLPLLPPQQLHTVASQPLRVG